VIPPVPGNVGHRHGKHAPKRQPFHEADADADADAKHFEMALSAAKYDAKLAVLRARKRDRRKENNRSFRGHGAPGLVAMHAAEESNHRPCCTCRESDEGKGKRQRGRGRVGMSDPTESSRARTPTRADTRQRSPRCVLHRAMCAAAAVQLVRCRLPRQAAAHAADAPTPTPTPRGGEKGEEDTGQRPKPIAWPRPWDGSGLRIRARGPVTAVGVGAPHRVTAVAHGHGWVDPRFGAGWLPSRPVTPSSFRSPCSESTICMPQ
jgi:hypothetical protein